MLLKSGGDCGSVALRMHSTTEIFELTSISVAKSVAAGKGGAVCIYADEGAFVTLNFTIGVYNSYAEKGVSKIEFN